MAQNSFGKINNCLINTGNILSLNDITRKSGQNPADELFEAINITLNEYRNESNTSPAMKTTQIQNIDRVLINRQSDDLSMKIAEQPLQDLKIGFKIFLNNDSNIYVQEALDEAFLTLKVSSVHNVIIAYNKQNNEIGDCLESIKNFWIILEEYVRNEKINQIGLADVDEMIFRQIYEWASIKPSIIQINLATCCVVPPTLQQFCKDTDVQLLTHSDPVEILSKDKIQDLLNISTLSVKWTLRFLVHIKCRGVLITKGYLICLADNQ